MVSVVGRAVCGRRCRFGSRICRFDCTCRGAFIRNVPKRLFGSGCLAFCSHGCSLLLTICKNRHVPRICKINSTNSAFFITNTRRAALRRTGFSSLRMSFRSREMACAPFFRGAGGAEIDVDVGAALFAGSDIGEKTDGSCSVAGCCGNFLVGAARAEEKRCGQR